MKQIKVIELFAGVGGFRLGLEGWNNKSASSGYKKNIKSPYKVVWSNQWEPSTKSQDASDIYEDKFGKEGHCNNNISLVSTDEIPNHDMLVGGFPCQDYSVARTLNKSAGLEGKKGVLWWDIHRIINEKKTKPKYLLLENVDRLIKSPVSQRGRDFAIMLASLSDLGYIIEWRIINAAEYGMPQRRRRVFILAYHKSTSIFKQIKKIKQPLEWILSNGVMAESFEVAEETILKPNTFELEGDLSEISSNFNKGKKSKSPFENSGIIIDRTVYTVPTKPNYDGPNITLGDIIIPSSKVAKEYFIDENSLDRWDYFKGAKKEKRIKKDTGFEYDYAEGGMVFPDPLDKPSRTIITGEGGASPSRFKHVIKTQNGKLRRLTPIELERLNMFPDNHTEGVSDVKRAFLMGNALVIGIIEKIGTVLASRV